MSGLEARLYGPDAPGDLAYDGSDEEPSRALTARERDVLCRVISDILGEIRRTGTTDCVPIRMGGQYDVERLASIRDAINARERCVCNIGVQECPLHPGRLWDAYQRMDYEKAFDARVKAGRERATTEGS